MLHGDTQRADSGLVRGVAKHSVRPIVDGIITGLPRKAVPSAATPVSACAPFATKIPSAAFGSGIFGEGAGAAKAEPEKKKAGRPKKEAK